MNKIDEPRERALAAVDRERNRQIKKGYSHRHDDRLLKHVWPAIIARELGDLSAIFLDWGRENYDERYRAALVKVAGVAVAALEASYRNEMRQ